MWSDAVVGLPVLSGQHLRPRSWWEDLTVQRGVAELAVEALYIAVPPR